MHTPMLYTSPSELERYGKIWDAWHDTKKPTRLWFQYWCIGVRHVPDDQKIAEFKRQLTLN